LNAPPASPAHLDDFRLRFGQHELVPIMIGGMGVDISSAELALEAARLGGVGHISDAMVKTVTDRHYKTKYVKAKQAMYKYNVDSEDKSVGQVRPGPSGRGHPPARGRHHVAQDAAAAWCSSTAWKS
jgi:NAD(P)H-dependent flavin oxidoreductase YrpB (nitropropane dioxygenase family)